MQDQLALLPALDRDLLRVGQCFLTLVAFYSPQLQQNTPWSGASTLVFLNKLFMLSTEQLKWRIPRLGAITPGKSCGFHLSALLSAGWGAPALPSPTRGLHAQEKGSRPIPQPTYTNAEALVICLCALLQKRGGWMRVAGGQPASPYQVGHRGVCAKRAPMQAA